MISEIKCCNLEKQDASTWRPTSRSSINPKKLSWIRPRSFVAWKQSEMMNINLAGDLKVIQTSDGRRRRHKIGVRELVA